MEQVSGATPGRGQSYAKTRGTVRRAPGTLPRRLGDTTMPVNTNVQDRKSRSDVIMWKILDFPLLHGVSHLLRISQK